jgi:hypothetical protein
MDSGCTGRFLLVNAPCLNKVKSRTPLTVRFPNGATMESSHTAELDIPELNALNPKHMFSREWPITIYFQLDSYATKAT